MLLLEAVQSAAGCWQLRLLVAFAAVRARSQLARSPPAPTRAASRACWAAEEGTRHCARAVVWRLTASCAMT